MTKVNEKVGIEAFKKTENIDSITTDKPTDDVITDISVDNITSEKTEEKKNDVKTKDEKTFKEKSVEAAANAALKAAITTNEGISRREADKTYFIEKQKFMLGKCKSDEVEEIAVDKIYAPYIGKVYTFNLNCIPITIYCDGKKHAYPKFIADIIKEKLKEISESNTYKELVDERLDQDVF